MAQIANPTLHLLGLGEYALHLAVEKYNGAS